MLIQNYEIEDSAKPMQNYELTVRSAVARFERVATVRLRSRSGGLWPLFFNTQILTLALLPIPN